MGFKPFMRKPSMVQAKQTDNGDYHVVGIHGEEIVSRKVFDESYSGVE